jgi:hypothetical protein
MKRQKKKALRNARRWIAPFMAGLAVSGITAFSIEPERAFPVRPASPFAFPVPDFLLRPAQYVAGAPVFRLTLQNKVQSISKHGPIPSEKDPRHEKQEVIRSAGRRAGAAADPAGCHAIHNGRGLVAGRLSGDGRLAGRHRHLVRMGFAEGEIIAEPTASMRRRFDGVLSRLGRTGRRPVRVAVRGILTAPPRRLIFVRDKVSVNLMPVMPGRRVLFFLCLVLFDRIV